MHEKRTKIKQTYKKIPIRQRFSYPENAVKNDLDKKYNPFWRFENGEWKKVKCLDNEPDLTDNSKMATTERPERRAGVQVGVPIGTPHPLPPLLSRRGRPDAPQNARKGVKRSPARTLKNYLLFYEKGKYVFADLDLKKQGHQQKYL